MRRHYLVKADALPILDDGPPGPGHVRLFHPDARRIFGPLHAAKRHVSRPVMGSTATPSWRHLPNPSTGPETDHAVPADLEVERRGDDAWKRSSSPVILSRHNPPSGRTNYFSADTLRSLRDDCQTVWP